MDKVDSNNEFVEKRIDYEEAAKVADALLDDRHPGNRDERYMARAYRQLLTEHKESWIMVERYCESFKDNDWRIVLKRGDEVYEFSVDETVFRVLGGGDE